MTTTRQLLGGFGEELAERVLQGLGMEVLARNWRCEHGEVDLVARDGDCLVVCEVKTRAGVGFGDPVEAVTFDKMLRLRRLAAAWLRDHAIEGVGTVRVDVIGVLRRPGERTLIRHVRGDA